MIKPELTEFGLEIKNLRKVYKGNDGNEPVVALEDLDLQVKRGSFFGLLGPNGAGKTTTLKMLSGLLHPSAGQAKVMGYTPWERPDGYRRQFALLLHFQSVRSLQSPLFLLCSISSIPYLH